MSLAKILPFIAVTFFSFAPLHPEVRCPGNGPSKPLHEVANALLTVRVDINGTGPYEFIVDTGAQVTTVDSVLASELHLGAGGTVGVSGAATYARNPFTYLDSVAVGGQTVLHTLAVIQDIAQLKMADTHIRGILGENFLAHFDVLINNQRHTLCLDTSKALAAAVTGGRTLLEKPYGSEPDMPFTRPLVVSAFLGAAQANPVLLRLDSGSNAPLLYASSLPAASLNKKRSLSREVNGSVQWFDVLPPRDIQVGRHLVRQVEFVTPRGDAGKGPHQREDGVLPTFAFESVFISYSDGYAVLKPWAH